MRSIPWYKRRKYRSRRAHAAVNELLGIAGRYVDHVGNHSDDYLEAEVLVFALTPNMPIQQGEIVDLWALFEEPGYIFPFDDPYVVMINERPNSTSDRRRVQATGLDRSGCLRQDRLQ